MRIGDQTLSKRAKVMPYDGSHSPVRRLSMVEATSSTQAPTRASPSTGLPSPTHRGSTHKPHKAHAAGHGRIAHARNPSYGKNINKLTKSTNAFGTDENGVAKHHAKVKIHTPSTSPSTQDIRRNSSNVTLPRVGSKTSVKRNSSNVSLKRNGSSGTQLARQGRQTTASRNTHAPGKGAHRPTSHNVAKFSVGSDEQDDDWTEESTSQSPTTTRHSSIGHGGPSVQETPPPDEAPIAHAHANFPDSPPESPATGSSVEPDHEPDDNHANPYSSRHIYSSQRPSRPPDADAVTSRLISRRPSHTLSPHVSSLSVNTHTSGTQTPPVYGLQESSGIELSLPENGVSRFLNPTPTGYSSGGSANTSTTGPPYTASNTLQSTASTYRNRSPSPDITRSDPTDTVRRAKSVGNLDISSASTLANTPNSRDSPLSYTIDPRKHRRPGGNTAAKLELWRTQVNIESSHGLPPATLRNPFDTFQPGMFGNEDRQKNEDREKKLWEQAQGEIGYLRLFRNPVIEGAGRAIKREKSKGFKKPRSLDGESQKERGRGKESRPPSVAERRSVRFEIGADGNGDSYDGKDDDDEGEELEQLLKRMWLGSEEAETYMPGL